MSSRTVLGAAILAGGVLLWTYSNERVKEYSKGVGLLKKTFSGSHSDKAARWETARVGGIVAVVGGAAILASGLVKK